jgi:hypothetical protein
VLESAGGLNAPSVGGTTTPRRLPGKEGEPPASTRLECWAQ